MHYRPEGGRPVALFDYNILTMIEIVDKCKITKFNNFTVLRKFIYLQIFKLSGKIISASVRVPPSPERSLFNSNYSSPYK